MTRHPLRVVALCGVAAVLTAGALWLDPSASSTRGAHATDAVQNVGYSRTIGPLSHVRLTEPARTQIRDSSGNPVATFTDGSRTAVVQGPERTFSEAELTTATVTTSAWVRLLPDEWQAGSENLPWFGAWLLHATDNGSPDVLEIAFQYVRNAPAMHENGIRYRGDAGFGPIDPNTGKRSEGSDFYDYLGRDWTFPNGSTRKFDQAQSGSVDCSGFARLVYGYRSGIPLAAGNASNGQSLPRQAAAIAESGPGKLVARTFGQAVTDYSVLQAGDLVFFDSSGAGTSIHHMGIYVGLDNKSHHRFISSRATVDGPTMSDVNGTSLLDDGRFYSKAFTAIRRI